MCKFIPVHISNGVVLGVMNILRRLQTNGRMYALSHGDNQNLGKSLSYIENQHELKEIYLGMSPISAVGCEVIATHNALHGIGANSDFGNLITEYEKDGIVLGGRLGVAPKAVYELLKKRGFNVWYKVITKNKAICEAVREIEGLSTDSRALIVTYYNDQTDLAAMIHTVAITVNSMGYVGHNVYGNGSITGPQTGIEELLSSINGGRIRPLCFIGIR